MIMAVGGCGYMNIPNAGIAATALSIHISISDSTYLLGCQTQRNE
jgi:hypothetical protein